MKTRILLRFIVVAGTVTFGIALMRATPVQGTNVGTLETTLPPTSSATDDVAIRAAYQQKIDGWNKGSGAGFAAAFTEDADLVGFNGTHLHGREQIASFHQRLFDTSLKGSRLHGQVKSVRFMTSDVAVMHALSATVMPGQTKSAPERDSIQTLVFRKHAGEWRIAAFQTSRLVSTRENA